MNIYFSFHIISLIPSLQDLHNAKSTFERCRFNLVCILTPFHLQVYLYSHSNDPPLLQGIQVHALANIEAKKKYEFLESISAVMDAHLRYFKQAWFLSICKVILVFWLGP